ncbi:helix-turn-helix domain-containing protein [Amycolatopsis sp. CA-161197]|uniref:helix-turn-helix domain-containing protein n=1 Tax=Amycolatopsis sp. CA-161197 TaxID=3239922 RepID=UPI003D8E796A
MNPRAGVPLARKAGVSAALVSRIENGKARPSVASLYALVQHLNLTVDELVDPAGARAEARRATPLVRQRPIRGRRAPGAAEADQRALVQLGETRRTLKLEVARHHLGEPAVGVRMVHAPFGPPE